jgi:cell division septation protein DedD
MAVYKKSKEEEPVSKPIDAIVEEQKENDIATKSVDIDKGSSSMAVKQAPLNKDISASLKSWSVQVLSISGNDTSGLNAYQQRIEAMGYSTYVAEIDGAKKLRVGPFESLNLARPVLQEMRAEGYSDAFLWNN